MMHAAAAVPDTGSAFGDEAARIRLGASRSTAPEVLDELARDRAITVRAAVAMNLRASEQTNLFLTQDQDERVRAFLAQKISALLPSLTRGEQAELQAHAEAVLAALVEDAAIRVRAALANCLKTMPEAPRDLVLRLAQDAALPVSDPIIRLSPLLSDADLLSLLSSKPETSRSVANRQGLSAQVSDAVVKQADRGAIRALLSNTSADIGEATIEQLATDAKENVDWHEPLVRRPYLSPEATRRLAGIIATDLIIKLQTRSGLHPDVAAMLQGRINSDLMPKGDIAFLNEDQGLRDAALRLFEAGALDEAALVDSARRGETRRFAAQLSVASGLPLAAIDRAVTLRSAKGLLSVAWKAGFSMRVGSLAQAMLGRLGPNAMIAPGPDGGFPLTSADMAWQIELLGQVIRPGSAPPTAHQTAEPIRMTPRPMPPRPGTVSPIGAAPRPTPGSASRYLPP